MRTSPSDRDTIQTRISEIRAGASQLSRLLADEALQGDEWDRAAHILAGCRAERKVLEENLRLIDGPWNSSRVDQALTSAALRS